MLLRRLAFALAGAAVWLVGCSVFSWAYFSSAGTSHYVAVLLAAPLLAAKNLVPDSTALGLAFFLVAFSLFCLATLLARVKPLRRR